MKTQNVSFNSLTLAIRWMARLSSIPVIAVFILMFLGEGLDPATVKPIEWVMLLFGPFGFMVGMILGWWKDGLGGAITIFCFFVTLLIGDFSGSGATYMAICASPGFLFLLSWILSNPALLSGNKPVSEENPPQPPAGQKP